MGIAQDKNYKELLAEICALYESTLIMGTEAQRKNKVETFWKMGRRLVTVEREDSDRSTYGERVVARLSEDMTKKYGGGFKERNVYYIRDFGAAYGADELKQGLSWSHYKALLMVADVEERARFESLVLEKGIGAKRLELLVKGGALVDGVPSDLDQALAPRKGRIGLGKVVVAADAAQRKRMFVDLGFYAQVPLRLEDAAGVEDEMVVSVKRKTGSGLGRMLPLAVKPVACETGERFCYDGSLISVVDGDTVRVRLHLGLQVYHVERLRLRAVAAAELVAEEGLAATALARELIKEGAPVRVLTYGQDRYGRWVGDVYFGSGLARLLNRELIEAGVARFVDIKA